MLDLSPTKLIIIFVVVVVLLGPKRLPQVARQLGAGWRKIVGFQQQVERELRESMPDLPSSQDIVRFARSPVAMLHQLAEIPGTAADGAADAPSTASAPPAATASAPPAATASAPPAADPDAPAAGTSGAPAAGTPGARAATSAGTPRSAARPGVPTDLRALAADDPSMN